MCLQIKAEYTGSFAIVEQTLNGSKPTKTKTKTKQRMEMEMLLYNCFLSILVSLCVKVVWKMFCKMWRKFKVSVRPIFSLFTWIYKLC